MPVERVQRALARAGFGSRRACEQLIVDARVTVNGTVATLGDRVDPEVDTVAVDGVTVNLDPNVRYYALHKPPGVVTTMNDPQGRPDIRGFLPEDGPRVFPVGRLDRDSEGPRGALRLTMTEGRKREVRRLLAEVGLPVTRLVRLRIGPVKLGNLPPGELRELTPEEIRSLAQVTDM